MTTIRTATGKEYYCDFMGTADFSVLYVRVRMEPEEVLVIFRDPEETKVLQWVSELGEIIREEHNYTKFTQMMINEGEPCPIRVRMLLDFDAFAMERTLQIQNGE